MHRRTLLASLGAAALAAGTAQAQAPAATPLGSQGAPLPQANPAAKAIALAITTGTGMDGRTDRAYGPPDSKATVLEFFSLTCTHCAAFAREVLPDVQAKLIDAGKLRYVFKPFPLNQVDLLAFQVALSLPPERYLPFAEALLASQDRWAFARGVNSTEELAKMAALAGMGRPAFDAAVANDALKQAILANQDVASKQFSVDSTPTFIFNGKPQPGEVSFATFEKLAGVSA